MTRRCGCFNKKKSKNFKLKHNNNKKAAACQNRKIRQNKACTTNKQKAQLTLKMWPIKVHKECREGKGASRIAEP